MNDAASALSADGRRIVPHVVEAPAIEAILGTAEEEKVDLITLGAKRRSALLDMLLGGITVPVTRRAALPVLVARPLQHGLRSVVVATDGSDAALKAARFLARLPLPDDTEVTVAHVLSPQDEEAANHDWDPAFCDDTIAAMRQAEGSTLAAHSLRAEMRTGDPATELLQLVSADLVVLGARKSSWIENTLDGSVADRLLLESPCSVLPVP